MLSFFGKKEEEIKKKEEEPQENKTEVPTIPLRVINKEEVKKEEFPEIKIKKPVLEQSVENVQEEEEDSNTSKGLDYITKQCIAMGMDIKEDVKKSSKAFFNSKNQKKANAYANFQNYLSTLEYREVEKIKSLDFLEFKDKEEQIFTSLKNGFAQYLTKGSSLDESNREIVNFIFNDIKKYPSKAHRYWYFREYIWQKRD